MCRVRGVLPQVPLAQPCGHTADGARCGLWHGRALVELVKQKTETYRVSHPRAYATGQLAFEGENLERFLIGRQLCVIFLVCFIARLTASNVLWFMRGSGVGAFVMEAGLLGALIVAVIAQLTPQIVAAKFPVHFMECRGMNCALRVCLLLEATGIAHATWLIAYAWIRLGGWRELKPKSDLAAVDATVNETPRESTAIANDVEVRVAVD